jgi:hypothetical protein
MALNDFGAVPAGSVLPIMWTSHDGATGANEAMSGLAVTDIEIYKGTSTTQRASDAGYALLDTDGIDIDSHVGVNGISIDLGDNTDAGFYAAGSFYNVIVGPVTIDGQTVNIHLATFRIVAAETVAGSPKADVSHFGGAAGTFASGRPEVNTTHAAGTAWGSGAITAASIAAAAFTKAKFHADTGLIPVDTGTAQAGGATSIQLATSASTTADIYNGHLVYILSGAGAGQARFITDYATNRTATVATWQTNPDNTSVYAVLPSNASSAAAVAGAVWDEALAGHVAAGSAGEALDAAGTAGDPWVTALPGAYGAGTAGKIIGDNINATISSRASQASVDTIDGIVDSILVDTAEIGAAGAGLTNINLPNQTMDIVGNITGNLSGSVGSVSGAVGSVTGNVGGSVASVAANGISASSLAADAGTELAAAVLAAAIVAPIEANIKQVNDVNITGDGNATPWGPA